MGDEGGDEIARCCHHPPVAAPLDDENLLGEILTRLPPLPSSILHASAVSKIWGHVAIAPSFLRRFCTHHLKPPILGFFEQYGKELVFTSILDPPDHIPGERFSLRPGGDGERFDELNYWSLLGCRHGHVLIMSTWWPVLLVFAPVSGGQRRLAIPPDFVHYRHNTNGGVLCAAGDDQGHVHGDCHSCPFKVVFVCTRSHEEPAFARVYSSETGMWADPVSTAEPCTGMVSHLPCTLIGNVLYWWLSESVDGMLEFDLDSQRLVVVKRPPFQGFDSGCIRIIRGENGGVALAVLSYPCFQIWDRKVSSHGVATWVLRKRVNMRQIIVLGSGIKTWNETIAGYSEDVDAVFISVSRIFGKCAFMVQLWSMQSRKLRIDSLSMKLRHRLLESSYHPFANFYTPGTVKARSTATAIEPPAHQSSGV